MSTLIATGAARRPSRPPAATARLALVLGLAAAGCGDSTAPTEGPDLRPIVYHRLDQDDAWRLYRTMANGGTPQLIDTDDREALWAAISPDGQKLAYFSPSLPQSVFVAGLDGSNATLVSRNASVQRVAWSRDGAKLALGIGREVWVMNADGSGGGPVADGMHHPSWTPDGRIVFRSTDIDGFGIFTMASDGSDVQRIVGGVQTEVSDPAWSPDGSQIVFAQSVEGSPSIFVVSADGSSPRRVTLPLEGGTTNDRTPRWSPSGKWIVFQRERITCQDIDDCESRIDIHIVRPDGTGLRNLTAGSSGGGRGPTW